MRLNFKGVSKFRQPCVNTDIVRKTGCFAGLNSRMVYSRWLFLSCFLFTVVRSDASFPPAMLYPLSGSMGGKLAFPLDPLEGKAQVGLCVFPLLQGEPDGSFLFSGRVRPGKGPAELQAGFTHQSAGAWSENSFSLALARSFGAPFRAFVEPSFSRVSVEKYGGAGSFSFRAGFAWSHSRWQAGSVFSWEGQNVGQKPVQTAFLTLSYSPKPAYCFRFLFAHHSAFSSRMAGQLTYSAGSRQELGVLFEGSGAILLRYTRTSGHFQLELAIGFHRFLGWQPQMGTLYAW